MTTRKHEDDLEPVDVGHADPGGDGSVAVLYRDGQAVLLPTAMRNLTGPRYEAVEELQLIARQIRAAQDLLGEAVEDARSEGLSWGSIGWCIGTSGEAARVRFGPPPAPAAGPPGRRRR